MNNDYKQRIGAVLQFIEEHIGEDLRLDTLAEVSSFSKYHFSRVFSAIIHKSPINYLTERRLHHAITYLRSTNKTMLDISSLCGFSSLSSFNAAFKKEYGTTPSAMRRSVQEHSNIPSVSGNNPEELSPPKDYDLNSTSNNFLRRVWGMNIELKELPGYKVAYVRHVGSYLETYQAWQTLGAWVRSSGLPASETFIGISLDDPAVTDENVCRYDACITVPEGYPAEGDASIAFRTLPGGLYALYKFYDTIDKLAIAYQGVYGQWLPESGYEPDDRHALEFCMNDPYSDPEGKAKVDLYIPIKRTIS
ncbi:AraC family transcriptional regulator [Paenibacillus sp. PastF-1]|uniref:AraC family transcriptional regulator n=1 Tax=unclassified Paenibacillus TaxID=185978 RepID=UPI002406C5F1|nr:MULTISPECIES: AraC family transcriptional regulator [unclassified Paenibacillus]MDF9858268.1 AraC family transcriptional regulator [Paenibacillus sp. PastF-1]MDH6483532.1 AraC family transcriptional regulator [Paenibacillus sp. PastH-2]MDH6510944.1 AraC family transcriptional regulator [Paenibacillus sp. PastM-3]